VFADFPEVLLVVCEIMVPLGDYLVYGGSYVMKPAKFLFLVLGVW
jgi:hypothetical protein